MCYSGCSVSELIEKVNDSDNTNFINMLKEIGHDSPFEHISFSFAIEGVSRNLLAQLTRHRHSSFSVKSQRYVKMDQFEYITPDRIKNDEVANARYMRQMLLCQAEYDWQVDNLIKKGFTEKEAIEDARYLMPGSSETKLMLTVNARSLFNFFSQRLCNRAQQEIRLLAEEMLKLVKEVAPNVFKGIGKPCAMLGYCPEGKMQCKELKDKVPVK